MKKLIYLLLFLLLLIALIIVYFESSISKDNKKILANEMSKEVASKSPQDSTSAQLKHLEDVNKIQDKRISAVEECCENHKHNQECKECKDSKKTNIKSVEKPTDNQTSTTNQIVLQNDCSQQIAKLESELAKAKKAMNEKPSAYIENNNFSKDAYIKSLEDEIARLKKNSKVSGTQKDYDKELSDKDRTISDLKKELANLRQQYNDLKNECKKPKMTIEDEINALMAEFNDYRYATKSYGNIKCGAYLSGKPVSTDQVCQDIRDDNAKANMILDKLEKLVKEKNLYNTYKDFIDKNRYLINQ